MGKTYTTIQGDKWDMIAFLQMGDVGYTDRLMNLNQKYRDYYIFPAGITLNLPEEEINISPTAPPWKQVSI